MKSLCLLCSLAVLSCSRSLSTPKEVVVVAPGGFTLSVQSPIAEFAGPELWQHSGESTYTGPSSVKGGPASFRYSNTEFHLYRIVSDQAHFVGSYPVGQKDIVLHKPGSYTVVVNNTAQQFLVDQTRSTVTLRLQAIRTAGDHALAYTPVFQRTGGRPSAEPPPTWNGRNPETLWIARKAPVLGFFIQPEAELILNVVYSSPDIPEPLRTKSMALRFPDDGVLTYDFDATLTRFEYLAPPKSRFPEVRLGTEDAVVLKDLSGQPLRMPFDPHTNFTLLFSGWIDVEQNGFLSSYAPSGGVLDYHPSTLEVEDARFRVFEQPNHMEWMPANSSTILPPAHAYNQESGTGKFFNYSAILVLREADLLTQVQHLYVADNSLVTLRKPAPDARLVVKAPVLPRHNRGLRNELVLATRRGAIHRRPVKAAGEEFLFEEYAGTYDLWLNGASIPVELKPEQASEIHLGAIQVPQPLKSYAIGRIDAGQWTPILKESSSSLPILALPGFPYVLRIRYDGAQPGEFEERTITLKNVP